MQRRDISMFKDTSIHRNLGYYIIHFVNDIIGTRKYAIIVSIKEHSFDREQLLSRSIKVVHFVVLKKKPYLRITIMVQRHVSSVIFLALVSLNVIQAGVIPQEWLQHENLSNFINLLDLPSSFHDFSDRVATSATRALGGVRSYFDTFPTRLGNILPNGMLHRLINRIQPGLTNPAILNGAADAVTNALASRVVPNTDYLRPGIFGRRLFGNNGGTDLGSNAAPAGTASAASSAA